MAAPRSLLFFTTAATAAAVAPRANASLIWGTLASNVSAHLETDYAAGVNAVTLASIWDRFEPRQGQVNEAYVLDLQVQIADVQHRHGDVKIILDVGMQYPPAWLAAINNCTGYVNQYGDVYKPNSPGKNVVAAIWNSAVRDAQESYLARLLAAVNGSALFAVRLGWGWYGELNFPENVYNGRSNCYWAFDRVAQGAVPALLPAGVPPCPVPGWKPGDPSPAREADAFINWYLDALRNYHDWQIAVARRHRPAGVLLMLYPSWGVRPGQLAAAVAGNLSGATSVEVNGELQRGFDFPRFIGGVADAGLVPYTTWMDAAAPGEDGPDAAGWSPAHWIASLAAAAGLQAFGENTGRNGVAAMALCGQRVQRFGLRGLVWAFEADLYDGSGGQYATLADYAALIRGGA